MKSVEVNHYKSKDVFQLSRTSGHDMYGYDLAKGFYNARYNNDGTQNGIDRADWWGANAGAVQLFNISADYPIPIIWENDNIKKGVFKVVSKNIDKTSYGHSERIGMRDLLDSYMEYRKIEPHDIRTPSHTDNIKDKSNPEYDILEYLKENATMYKLFLVGSGVVVKFWSERKPCDYNADSKGGKCTEFIENISPMGSKYGYITETKDITFQTDEIKKRNKKASTNLKIAYEIDDVVHSLIENIVLNYPQKEDMDSLNQGMQQLKIDGINIEFKINLIDFIEENQSVHYDFPNDDVDDKDLANFLIYQDSADKYQSDFEVPLISALIQADKFELAKKLLDTGEVDLSIKDTNSSTPLDYAVSKRHKILVERIKELGGVRNTGYREDENGDKDLLNVYKIDNSQLASDDLEHLILGNNVNIQAELSNEFHLSGEDQFQQYNIDQ